LNVNFDFTGRTIIVTGGARGIGAGLVACFHDAGAHVVLVDRDVPTAIPDGFDERRVLMLACDVAEPDECDSVIEETLAWTGAVDVVVNNAGITRDGVVWKMTDANWEAVIGVHLTGTFNMTRAAIGPMRAAGRGRIVNVTSYTGLHGNFGQANYAAAKAGIIGFTKAVAKETAGFGITVNAVSPNAETAMVAAVPADRKAELEAQVPMGRFADPSEMAAGIAFLASDEAGYITGVVLPIDGGLSM
jgi:3-oxoacyl-[acyl-carrier protein] reductase